jgi:hypothetical protein
VYAGAVSHPKLAGMKVDSNWAPGIAHAVMTVLHLVAFITCDRSSGAKAKKQ